MSREPCYGLKSALHNVLTDAASKLSATSSSSRLDAELLLSHVLQVPKIKLISGSKDIIDEESLRKFEELVGRRLSSEPIAYITGKKEFWDFEVSVDPSVLIPRPETELLVEKGVELLSGRDSSLNILDLGTGSGAISIALSREMAKSGKTFRILAADISEEALLLANRNFEILCPKAQVEFLHSDLFAKVNSRRFDLIVSNPPYVPVNDPDISPETDYEPKEALFSGLEGLDCIGSILKDVSKFLQKDGVFFCEMGWNQRTKIEKLVSNHYPNEKFSVQFFPDLSGKDRVFSFTLD